MIINRVINFSLLMSTLVLVGCGGGDENDEVFLPESVPVKYTGPPLVGVFVDSPVAGINYTTISLNPEQNRQGTTNLQGEFEYFPGGSIAFSIGDIDFPFTRSNPTVSPLDFGFGSIDSLDTVNAARLLQTLDVDGDPSNGITISPGAHDAATGMTINFFSPDFDNEVLPLVQNSGSVTTILIDDVKAIEHLANNVSCPDGTNDSVVGKEISVQNINNRLTFYDDFTFRNNQSNFLNGTSGTYEVNGLTVKLVYNTNTANVHHEVYTFSAPTLVRGSTFNRVAYEDAAENIILDTENNVAILVINKATSKDLENHIVNRGLEIDDGRFIMFHNDYTFSIFNGWEQVQLDIQLSQTPDGQYTTYPYVVIQGIGEAIGAGTYEVGTDTVKLTHNTGNAHHDVFTFPYADYANYRQFNWVSYEDAAENITLTSGDNVSVIISLELDGNLKYYLPGIRLAIDGDKYIEFHHNLSFVMFDVKDTVRSGNITGTYEAGYNTVKLNYDDAAYHDVYTFPNGQLIPTQTFDWIRYEDVAENITLGSGKFTISEEINTYSLKIFKSMTCYRTGVFSVLF